MRLLGYAVAFLAAVVLILPAPVQAASVTIENFSTMSAFQASPLYAFISGSGGTGARKAKGVRGVRQGPSDVPASSAGAANNVVVTPEILTATDDVPDVFSLNANPAYYDKKFVSLGTSASPSPAPYIDIELTPASSLPGGGYNGYDIVVFDLGKNLVTGSGNNNTEATTFQVELVSEGIFYNVGSVTSTMGNFINAILLDVTDIPGIPGMIDAVRITDVSGTGQSASGGIDIDGALTLNLYSTVPARTARWGDVKSLYTR